MAIHSFSGKLHHTCSNAGEMTTRCKIWEQGTPAEPLQASAYNCSVYPGWVIQQACWQILCQFWNGTWILCQRAVPLDPSCCLLREGFLLGGDEGCSNMVQVEEWYIKISFSQSDTCRPSRFVSTNRKAGRKAAPKQYENQCLVLL